MQAVTTEEPERSDLDGQPCLFILGRYVHGDGRHRSSFRDAQIGQELATHEHDP